MKLRLPSKSAPLESQLRDIQRIVKRLQRQNIALMIQAGQAESRAHRLRNGHKRLRAPVRPVVKPPEKTLSQQIKEGKEHAERLWKASGEYQHKIRKFSHEAGEIERAQFRARKEAT